MSRPARQRPIARLVLVAGVLLLGGVSAGSLSIAFLPAWSLPELSVDLRLPEGSELDDFTRRWILPLESSIRAVGGVRGMAGEVNASGGNFRVRFRAGTDAERKAARLESELAGLRRRLPVGARLSVWPVGQGAGDESAVVWLDVDTESGVDPRLIETLRELPEVRGIEVAGVPRQELWVSARHGAQVPAAMLEATIDRGLRSESLGWVRQGGRHMPVRTVDQRGIPLAHLMVRRGAGLVPLNTLAKVELRQEEAPWIAHLEGERGVVLLVSREALSSPLALERSMRRVFEAWELEDRVQMLIDEAAPLRRMLWRLLGGFLAAVAVTSLMAWWTLGGAAAGWQALALPTASAGAVTGMWLAGLSLDVTTLPALTVGVSSVLLCGALRLGKSSDVSTRVVSAKAVTVIVTACTLPVAVFLAGGRLAPLLAAPVRVFVIAVVAGIVALAILPRPRLVGLPSGRLTKPLQWSMRNPWTVWLATAASRAGSNASRRPGESAPTGRPGIRDSTAIALPCERSSRSGTPRVRSSCS